MPFELSSDGPERDDLARMSEWLLAELSTAWGEQIEVVGPRSTAPYSAFPFPDMRRLETELKLDYVVNARLLDRDGESELIVELIRLDDGDHSWVRLFSDPVSWTAAGDEVRDGVVEALRLTP
jgi:TolB-like protein